MRNSGKILQDRNFRHSAIAALCAWFASALFLEEIALSLIPAILVFALAYSSLLYYPKLKKRKFAALIEKDMPFALLSLAVETEMDVQFETALGNIARQDYGLVSAEFRKIVSEIRDSGASVQEALFGFSERANSLDVKRAITQIVAAYEQGSGKRSSSPLKKLAHEMLLKQHSESKEFSNKLVVFSLMFIAVSAIVPALFQAFIIVGSAFLALELSALQILLIVALLFPALDVAVLLYIRARTPEFLKGS